MIHYDRDAFSALKLALGLCAVTWLSAESCAINMHTIIKGRCPRVFVCLLQVRCFVAVLQVCLGVESRSAHVSRQLAMFTILLPDTHTIRFSASDIPSI
jgi:hypothetical protein